MNHLTDIKREWEELQNTEADTSSIERFLEHCVEAGQYVTEPAEREQLQKIAHEVGDRVFLESMEFPLTIIRPAMPFYKVDFSTEVAQYSKNPYFQPRTWLKATCQEWLLKGEENVLFIVGEPGIGKTTMAGWLAQTWHPIVACYFCSSAQIATARSFVETVAAGLYERLDGFSDSIDPTVLELVKDDPEAMFHEIVVRTTRSLGPPSEPMVILIDGLDELGTQQESAAEHSLVKLISEEVTALPSWLRLVMTGRFDPQLLSKFPLSRVLEVKPDQSENLENVAAYIERRVSEGPLGQKRVRDVDVGAIVASSEGNFLLAKLTLDDLESGALTPGEVGWITPSIGNAFLGALSKRFPDIEGYREEVQQILGILAVAGSPLTFQILQRATGSSPRDLDRKLVDLQQDLVTIFDQEAPVRYGLFHNSLKTFLTSEEAQSYRCDSEEANRRLGAALIGDWQDSYAVKYAFSHVLQAKAWTQVRQLLANVMFLTAPRSGEEQDWFHEQIRRFLSDKNISNDKLQEVLAEIQPAITKSSLPTTDKALALDQFSYWMHSHRDVVSDLERREITKKICIELDASCARLSRELMLEFLDARDYPQSIRFAELYTWVLQRAKEYSELVKACEEAFDTSTRVVREDAGRKTIWKLIGLEFQRMRASALFNLGKESAYKELEELSARTENVKWAMSATEWKNLDYGIPARYSEIGEKAPLFQVVARTDDSIAALFLLHLFELSAAHSRWVLPKDFHPDDPKTGGSRVTVLIGGPKVWGKELGELFLEADPRGYWSMYGGKDSGWQPLVVSKGKTLCCMAGGASKVETLQSVVELKAHTKVRQALAAS